MPFEGWAWWRLSDEVLADDARIARGGDSLKDAALLPLPAAGRQQKVPAVVVLLADLDYAADEVGIDVGCGVLVADAVGYAGSVQTGDDAVLGKPCGELCAASFGGLLFEPDADGHLLLGDDGLVGDAENDHFGRGCAAVGEQAVAEPCRAVVVELDAEVEVTHSGLPLVAQIESLAPSPGAERAQPPLPDGQVAHCVVASFDHDAGGVVWWLLIGFEGGVGHGDDGDRECRRLDEADAERVGQCRRVCGRCRVGRVGRRLCAVDDGVVAARCDDGGGCDGEEWKEVFHIVQDVVKWCLIGLE